VKIDLTTPALFFSAISLLMLAFTNRFLALAQLVRNLHSQYKEQPSEVILGQIKNLRTRLHLIRSMQITGISSLLLCVICMFLIYIEALFIAEFLFGISMVLLVLSLTLSIREILISVKALDIHLSDVEKSGKKNG
jgi:multisubunit Na+/H+ antiporter MnhG subunit